MSRLDQFTVRQVLNAVRAGIRPGLAAPVVTSSAFAGGQGAFYTDYGLVASGALPIAKANPWVGIVKALWSPKHPLSPGGFNVAPKPTELNALVAQLDPFIHPTPEEAAELAAFRSKTWINPLRGAELQIFWYNPLESMYDARYGAEAVYPASDQGIVYGKSWVDAKPIIVGMPRLEAIFLKFPWDYPTNFWQAAWTNVVGKSKIIELARLAATDVSNADLDAAFRTTIAENVDAIIAETERLMNAKAKKDAKQGLLRTIATVAIGIMTAGAAGPLVGALATQAIKIPDQIAGAKAAADALKAQDAAKAAQDRAAAEADADAFYDKVPGPFQAKGYTSAVWHNLNFDQKIAVMQAISKGQELSPWPGVPLPVATVPTPAQGTQEQFPVIDQGSEAPTPPYNVYVEGELVGQAKDAEAAAAMALQFSSVGNRVEVVARQYYPGTKMMPKILSQVLGIRTADTIVTVPNESVDAVKAMSPDQVKGVLERAKETVGAAAPAKGGFPVWLLAIPVAVYAATKS
jgi:hypothetical protein